MKLQRSFILFMALCLVGCSFGTADRSTATPHEKTPFPTSQTAPTSTIVATEPAEIPTALPETELATTTPTIPPQAIVQPEPLDDDFVRVQTYIPDIVLDLRYATEHNFTSQKIYEFTDVWLRYGTVKKLILVQEELKQIGLCLKIWDGFRPPSAQFKLWNACPDPTYVSNPNNGFSSHSRGNTVDLTLVGADGVELVMPTGFDDFSDLADRDYSDCSEEAATNATLLEQVMIKHGFKPYSGEWWHFSDTQLYPVEQVFEPISTIVYYVDHNASICLLTRPTSTAEVITRIPTGEQLEAVAKCGDYALIEYNGLYGYVPFSNIQPAG